MSVALATTAMPRRAAASQHALRLIDVRLHHAEIERKLDEAEVMLRAARLRGDSAMRGRLSASFLRNPSQVAAPYQRILPRVHQSLEPRESARGCASSNSLARAEAELRFGIVQVEDVDRVDAQIGAAAVDLVRREIPGAIECMPPTTSLRLEKSGTAPGVRNPAFVQTTISSRCSCFSAAPMQRSDRCPR